MNRVLTYADRSIITVYYVPHIWFPLASIAAVGFLISMHQTISAAFTVIAENYFWCGTARASAENGLIFTAALWLAIPGFALVLAERCCQPTLTIRCLFWASLTAWLAANGTIGCYMWLH